METAQVTETSSTRQSAAYRRLALAILGLDVATLANQLVTARTGAQGVDPDELADLAA
jgi:hypothetical protein